MSIDYEFISCSFAKIGLLAFKKNVDVVRVTTSVLYFFIENLTQSIKIKISKIANPMAKQLIINFIRIISELQKSFRNELIGNPDISQLTSMESLKAVQEIKDFITDWSTTVKGGDTSCMNIFNDKDISLEECVNLLQEVISKPTSINAAMSSNEKSNVCCQTLMALSKEFMIIGKNPEAYNRILSLVYDIITSKYLSNDNFKFVETYLMEAILSKNYWLGVASLVVFSRYLQHITSKELINHYFQLLKNLRHHSLPPGLQQQRISFIFKLFCKTHQKKFSEMIAPDLNFKETFQLIKAEACEENYQKLIESLKNIDEQDTRDFCDLIEMLEECNWYEFTPLVIQVLQSIKSFKEIDKKMICLLKIQRSFDKEMPFRVKVKILEILSTCLPHMDEFKGLSDLVESSLEKLLNENCILRRSWYNLTKGNSLQRGKYEIDESVTIPENIIDILNISKSMRKRPLISESNQKQNLKKVLLYSKWLSTQNISKEDRQIICEITRNFEKK